MKRLCRIERFPVYLSGVKMTEEEKKEIQKVLENTEPCLYLGAGFSYGAKRGDENIPLGKDE